MTRDEAIYTATCFLDKDVIVYIRNTATYSSEDICQVELGYSDKKDLKWLAEMFEEEMEQYKVSVYGNMGHQGQNSTTVVIK